MLNGGLKQWTGALPVVILTIGAAIPPAIAEPSSVLTGSPESTATEKASEASPAKRGVISLNYLLDNRTPSAAAAKPSRPVRAPQSFTDKLLLARAERIERELSKAAGIQKPVDVELDSSEQINSWTDGHTVTITAGLMRFVGDDNELAAVLGHETGHIRAGHIGKEGRADIWALIGTALLSGVAGPNAAMASYVSSAMVLRKYSRDEESEADRIGLELMQAAGYDGRAVGRFFARLSQSEMEDPALFATFFADHPLSAERLRRLGTYPNLNPDLLPNRLKLEKGLLHRGAPASAEVLREQLARQYPQDPIIQAEAGSRLSALAASVPKFAANDLAVVPEGPDTLEDSPAAIPSLAVAREQTQKTASQFYECLHTLEGLGNGYVGINNQSSTSNLLLMHMTKSALNSMVQLGNTMDPTAAAILSIQRASALEQMASHYPVSSESLSPRDASLLAAVTQQTSTAAEEMQEAVEDSRVASAAGERDVHDLAVGLSHLEEWIPESHSQSAEVSGLQNGTAWFSAGEAGLSQSEAHDALQKASSAELRLEMAALNWQGRSLTPVQKTSLVQWAHDYLALPIGKLSPHSDSEELGTALLQDLVTADGEHKAAKATADLTNGGNSYSIEIVGFTPHPGALTARLARPADPISLAQQKGLDMDRLQTLFRPVFVHIEQEGNAAAQLEQGVK